MKIQVFDTNEIKPHRIGVLPTGGLMVEEVSENTTLIRAAGHTAIVNMPFDQVVSNMDADLETWSGR